MGKTKLVLLISLPTLRDYDVSENGKSQVLWRSQISDHEFFFLSFKLGHGSQKLISRRVNLQFTFLSECED